MIIIFPSAKIIVSPAFNQFSYQVPTFGPERPFKCLDDAKTSYIIVHSGRAGGIAYLGQVCGGYWGVGREFPHVLSPNILQSVTTKLLNGEG